MTPPYSEHLTPVTAYGHTVILNSYGCRLTVDIEQWMIATWRSAFAQIAEHAREIPPALWPLFTRLGEIVMPLDDMMLGDLGRSHADGKIAMAISYPYMRAWSTATLASLPFHEMTHDVLRGVYSGADLWLSEKAASANQLTVMKILEAPQSEIAYITWWGSDANRAAQEAHMLGGYSGPPISAT